MNGVEKENNATKRAAEMRNSLFQINRSVCLFLLKYLTHHTIDFHYIVESYDIRRDYYKHIVLHIIANELYRQKSAINSVELLRYQWLCYD